MESSGVKEEKTEPVIANNTQENDTIKPKKEENENETVKSEQSDVTAKSEPVNDDENKQGDVKKEIDPLIQSFYSEVDFIFRSFV